MASSSPDVAEMKEAIKAALVEVLEEHSDFFQSLVRQAMEDVALIRAIQEGQQSETVPRDEVFEIRDHDQ